MGLWEKFSGAGRISTSWVGTRAQKVCCLSFSLSLLCSLASTAGDYSTLWGIGKPDGDNREFALAPGGYAQFGEDAVFFVGESEPARDWPYAHPGPADAWAGGRSHTFIVVFGLKEPPPEGEARLKVRLLDTHASGPPQLEFRLNDAVLIRTYSSAFLWRRGGATTVAQALAGEPCKVPHQSEPQGEAIGFAADGTGYYTVSEGANQPLYFFAKQ